MLELKNISLSLDRDGEAHPLLDDITFSIPPGHLLAIVGPSGCGKTTLLKTVAGLKHHDQGEIHWEGRNVEDEKDLHPSELGYVPQFSIAHDLLTVEECVASAVALRTCQPDDESAWALVETTLQQTGLSTLADRQVKVLSGGQRRRLGLAMELVTNPTLLLCDEVTSGLDPKSEREITQLLHDLAQNNPRRIVINVTHSLSNLSLFDTILVLHEGRVVYHGPPRALSHYFSVEQAEEIYPKLGRRSSERWSESWSRHRDAYYATYGLAPKKDETKGSGNGNGKHKESGTGDLKPAGDREPDRIKLPSAASFPDDGKADEKATLEKEEEDEGDDWSKYKKRHEKKQREKAKARGELPKESGEEQHLPEISDDHRLPGIFAQTRELLRRRWTIFWRDKTQLWLQVAMILGFPLLVVIFGLEPIPQVRKLSVRQDSNVVLNKTEEALFKASQIQAGGVVSGLILMQVVLVTLMASNNAAREIAGERDILERERLGGLRATSYVLSKILFLGTFVLVQALWMGLFVEVVCSGIPGDLLVKLLMLVMASAAMTSICLGISAMMRSPEKATILSIYLVGFQLPLSGALLALPKAIAPISQFFIAAYWSWAGSLSSMKSTDFYDAVRAVTTTNIEHWTTAVFVLALHVLVGLAFTYAGTKNSQWD
ncbi:ATP-binding cassette domain-containing protein [Roseimicrobium sp. ORNL1]|uniref:ATP-binding cassette domain-containing protein n=1 Tax=Roseimicrobium sp. ORNL1 TaxID=2711231 RepID=UPI0013E14B2F|nr:ATP-binding cassette domain-containing protein [Roseimicrobium sp. ORNL1]QIF02130.1 ATP-binding cassette domain-containing protein [Roseimicrobium sp. ORNL1]